MTSSTIVRASLSAAPEALATTLGQKREKSEQLLWCRLLCSSANTHWKEVSQRKQLHDAEIEYILKDTHRKPQTINFNSYVYRRKSGVERPWSRIEA